MRLYKLEQTILVLHMFIKKSPILVFLLLSGCSVDNYNLKLSPQSNKMRDALYRVQTRLNVAIGDTQLFIGGVGSSSGVPVHEVDTVKCPKINDNYLGCTDNDHSGDPTDIRIKKGMPDADVDQRLLHELIHAMTHDEADHSSDGLFQGVCGSDEILTESTLVALCSHFPCEHMTVETR